MSVLVYEALHELRTDIVIIRVSGALDFPKLPACLVHIHVTSHWRHLHAQRPGN